MRAIAQARRETISAGETIGRGIYDSHAKRGTIDR